MKKYNSEDKKGCDCSEDKSRATCRTCGIETSLLYWCETCKQLVPDKRCPGCGLKTRKVRQTG